MQTPIRRSRKRILIFMAALIGIAILILYAVVARIGYEAVSAASSSGLSGTPTGAYQDVTFPSRGQNYVVHAFFLPGNISAPALISVHGYRNTRHSEYQLNRAADLRTLGYNILSIDLSDNGGDTIGNNRISMGYSERWDVLGAYDYLIMKGFSPDRIGLVGESMGASTILLAAALEPHIRAIWADSGYTRAGIILGEQAQKNRVPAMIVPGALLWGVVLSGDRIWEAAPIDAASTLAAHKQAVYLIHDEKDKTVPFHHGVEMNAAFKAAGVNVTFWEVPDLDHAEAILYRHEEYLQRLDTFFKANLGKAF